MDILNGQLSPLITIAVTAAPGPLLSAIDRLIPVLELGVPNVPIIGPYEPKSYAFSVYFLQ